MSASGILPDLLHGAPTEASQQHIIDHLPCKRVLQSREPSQLGGAFDSGRDFKDNLSSIVEPISLLCVFATLRETFARFKDVEHATRVVDLWPRPRVIRRLPR